jgi:hypothetical protein
MLLESMCMLSDYALPLLYSRDVSYCTNVIQEINLYIRVQYNPHLMW